MKISTLHLPSSIAFTALLAGLALHAQAAGESISYFDGKEDRTMSVTSSTFTPTHPACCTPKAPKEPFVIPAPKEEVAPPPPPAPVILKESDSDNDGVVDSNDQCPDTPKGYKVDPKGCPRNVTLHLNFASNSSVLPASADKDVNALTEFMNENPAATITIIGHTDSTGQKAKNQTLSENRAQALGTRLVQNGIAANRIKTSGKGISEPISSNKKPAGRAQNRRIEIQIR
jgi:outer membrane protein OmpA-like peptidoglycan-associated protein